MKRKLLLVWQEISSYKCSVTKNRKYFFTAKYVQKRIFFSWLVVFFAVSFCKAQVPSLSPNNGVVPAVFNSTGGTYDNSLSYFRFEWSFGELAVIQSFSPADSSLLVTHGVLQPCTDKIGTSPLTLVFDKSEYRLFPNPTAGKFEVDFFVRATGQMSLQLVNSLGQILEKRSYHYDGCCRIELFDLTRYPDGIYFIVADLKTGKLRSDGQEIFRHSGLKVIKLNQ